MYILAPSLFEADYQNLGQQLSEIKKAGAEYVHIDVMDGNFVPNISFGAKMIKGLRTASDIFFDIHLMVQEPDRFIDQMIAAGSDSLTVHYEACTDFKKTLEHIRSGGVRSGVALKPQTSIDVLTPDILKLTDVVQLMSIEPGIEGQKFRPETFMRIQQVKKILKKMQLQRDIEIDGNITFDNVENVIKAGANIIVAGRSIFESDIQENIKHMKKKMSGCSDHI